MVNHCGATGCPNGAEVLCGYCGIPLCQDHAKSFHDSRGVQYFCSECFLYVTDSGLLRQPENRRLVPNVLLINPSLCTGCRTCQLVCSYEKSRAFSTRGAAIQVGGEEYAANYAPQVCMHCSNPSCIEACPSGALKKDEVSGLVTLDRENCRRCGACKNACPHEGIHLDETGLPIMCDLCGGDPKCVQYCSPHAMQWVKKHEVGVRGPALVARIALEQA